MITRDLLGKARSGIGIIRAYDNWAKVLTDHLGVARAPYRARLRNGLVFNVRPGTDDTRILFEIFVRGCYDAAVVAPGGTIVDIGANTGIYSILAAQQAARVIACEPHPTNLAILRKNLELNRAPQVEVVDCAISGSPGISSLILPDDDSFVGRYSLHPGRGTRSLEVTCITLDDLFRRARLVHVDLLKIDCQGSEYEILYGASRENLSRVSQIIVECEVFADHPGWSQAELDAYLQGLGFTVLSRGNILHASREQNS